MKLIIGWVVITTALGIALAQVIQKMSIFTVITKGNKVRQYHDIDYLTNVRMTEKDYLILRECGSLEGSGGNPITWPTDAEIGLRAIADVKAGTLRFGNVDSTGLYEYVVSEYVMPVVSSEDCDLSVPIVGTKHDPVNHPSHYTDGGIECIDAIKASMSTEAFLGFLKGNVQKYMWRYEKKVAPVEDLKKAQWYLSKLIEEQERS